MLEWNNFTELFTNTMPKLLGIFLFGFLMAGILMLICSMCYIVGLIGSKYFQKIENKINNYFDKKENK